MNINWKAVREEAGFGITIILLLVGIGGLVWYVDWHEAYMHNVDLIFNSVKDDALLDSMIDYYEVDTFISFKDLYILSMTGLRDVMFLIAFFAFVVGLGIGQLTARTAHLIEKLYPDGKRNERSKSFSSSRGRQNKAKKKKH